MLENNLPKGPLSLETPEERYRRRAQIPGTFEWNIEQAREEKRRPERPLPPSLRQDSVEERKRERRRQIVDDFLNRKLPFALIGAVLGGGGVGMGAIFNRGLDTRFSDDEAERGLDEYEARARHVRVGGFEEIGWSNERVHRAVYLLFGSELVHGSITSVRLENRNIPMPANYHGPAKNEAAHCTGSPGRLPSEIVFGLDGVQNENEFLRILVHESVHAFLDAEYANEMDQRFRDRLDGALLNLVRDGRITWYAYVNDYIDAQTRANGRRPTKEELERENRSRKKELLAELITEIVEIDPQVYGLNFSNEPSFWLNRTIQILRQRHVSQPQGISQIEEILKVLLEWRGQDFLERLQTRHQQVGDDFRRQQFDRQQREQVRLRETQELKIRTAIQGLRFDNLRQMAESVMTKYESFSDLSRVIPMGMESYENYVAVDEEDRRDLARARQAVNWLDRRERELLARARLAFQAVDRDHRLFDQWDNDLQDLDYRLNRTSPDADAIQRAVQALNLSTQALENAASTHPVAGRIRAAGLAYARYLLLGDLGRVTEQERRLLDDAYDFVSSNRSRRSP